MDSACYSRKRKLPPLTSLFSVFTRHESQIRKLPKRSSLGAGAGAYGDAETHTISSRDPLSVREVSPRAQEDYSCLVVKDLRSRRVFSLNPKPSLRRGVGSDPKGQTLGEPHEDSLKSADDVISTSCSFVQEYSSNKAIGRSLYSDDNENEEMGNPDPDVDRTRLCERKTCRMEPDSRKQDASDSEMPNQLDGSIDGFIQTTPPEATEVLQGLQVEQNGGTCLPRRTDVVSEDSGAEFSRRDDSVSKRELGRNPRFRGRLFKTPGSFGYRRLLPYLMDIANEDSCTARVSQSQEKEKGLEGKSLQTFLRSSCNDIPTDESIKRGSTKTTDTIAPTGNATVGMHNGLPKDEPENCLSTSSMMNEDLEDRAVSSPLENRDSILIVQDSVLTVGNDAGANCYDAMGQVEVESIETIGSLTSTAENVSCVCPVSSFPTEEKVDTQCFLEETQPISGGTKQFQTVPLLISCSRENGSSCLAEGNGSGSDEALDQIHDLNEAKGLIPIPDSLLSGEAEPSKDESLKSVSASANGAPQNSSDSNVSKVDVHHSILKGSEGQIAKGKLVLNPCSRLKLFKAQDSFSYRRMLPFLMEIAKDYSCAPGNGQPQKLLNKTQEEAGSPPERVKSQNFPTSQLNDDYGSFEHNCSFPDSPVHGTCSGRDQLLQVEDVGQSRHSKCQSSYGIVCVRGEGNPEKASLSSIGFDYPNNSTQLILSQSSEHVDFCARSAPELSSDAKDNELGQSMHSLSQMATPDHFGFPDEPSRRGIMKRNPRGCRGLCNCLTCASFRLNAERAFDFSRNQMKDAEEVAFDLIKELSYLRAIVQRTNIGASSPEFFQVREACRNATEAEEVAKDRLRQMNDDLNVHCRVVRLHRPRVTFNDHGQKLLLGESTSVP